VVAVRSGLRSKRGVAAQAATKPFVTGIGKMLTRTAVAAVELGGSEPEPPATTWLRFLEHIGLQDLNPKEDSIDTTTTMADYLPADLLAVPAYVEVGLIVVMAATSGAHSFHSKADAQQSQYPVIIGSDFQFDFRHHPTLGTIGAFSRYRKSQAVHITRLSLGEQYMSAIEHARGNISIVQLSIGRPGVQNIDLELDFSLATSSISLSLNVDDVAICLRHDCVVPERPCLIPANPFRHDKHSLF
jgi:hypothetical protein